MENTVIEFGLKNVKGNDKQIIIKLPTNIRTINERQLIDSWKKIGGIAFISDPGALTTMPKGEGKEVEICFFNLFKEKEHINDFLLTKEFKKRGLSPADPYSLMLVNQIFIKLLKFFPNCSHWKTAKGNWFQIAFEFNESPLLSLHKNILLSEYHPRFWFAGIKKI